MTESNEPKHLRHGKEVHKRIQKEWHKSAESSIVSEKTITKPSGGKGRMETVIGILLRYFLSGGALPLEVRGGRVYT